MKKSASRALALSGVMGLLVATFGASAEAGVDECAVAPANETITWGANQAFIKSAMSGATYGHGTCKGYIVDVNVSPATATISGYSPEFNLAGFDPERETNGGLTVANVPEAECSKWEETVGVYRKSGAEFARIGGGTSRGQWSSGFPVGCRPTRESTFKSYGPLAAPKSGTETYRVVFGAALGTAVAHAAVGGSHLPAAAK